MNIIRRDRQPSTQQPAADRSAPPTTSTPAAPANTARPQANAFETTQRTGSGTAPALTTPQTHVPLPSIAVGELHGPTNGPLPLTDPAAKAAIKTSLDYLNKPNAIATGGANGASASQGFTPSQVFRDDLGMTHVRLDRTQDGIKVFGEQVITHLGADGSVRDTTGGTEPLKFAPGAQGAAALSNPAALATAQKAFAADTGGLTPQGQPTSEMVYFKADDGAYHKAYHVTMTNTQDGTKPFAMNYMVDAANGKVLDKYNTIDGFFDALPAATPITVTGAATPNAPINDNQTVTSTIHVDKDLDLSKLTADLDINHTYKGDLVVKLTSPSGKTVDISNRAGGSADNIKQTFDLSTAFAGEKTVGDWKLTVSDQAAQDVGKLNSWKLNLTGVDKAPPPPPPPPGNVVLKGTATPEAAIKDNQTVTSKITIADDATIDSLKFTVDANHTYRGDLTATLTSPDGTTVQLLNREGGSADDWKVSAQDLAQFKDKSAKGDWTLTVKDNAAVDVGTLHSWGLEIAGHTGNPPPPPPPPPAGDGTGHSLYSGDVKLQTIKNADGTYSLVDNTRGGSKTLDALNKEQATGNNQFKDNNNLWGETGDSVREKAAIDAHYGAAMTWDFYKNVLGRNSIDGNGEALNSYVHLSNNYVNAYWDGKQMQYGDGDGQNASALTSLDIAGHEITHGMTERTAGLVYSGESGGLNEAMSDIMGKGVEWYAAQQNPAVNFSWGVGHDVWTPGNSEADALRYMNDPTKDGYSIDNFSKYAASDKEVHRTSGIFNNAFTLMVEGGTNKTSGTNVPGGIGMEKALKILYRAEVTYFTPNTTFKQAAAAAIKAATDLYGAGSAEVAQTTAAMKAVGLG